jgi:hypothetical protein
MLSFQYSTNALGNAPILGSRHAQGIHPQVLSRAGRNSYNPPCFFKPKRFWLRGEEGICFKKKELWEHQSVYALGCGFSGFALLWH